MNVHNLKLQLGNVVTFAKRCTLSLSIFLSHNAVFILFFPALFALGLMPQANTFAIYFMEQIDMHVFGGTASTGLLCSLYALTRSILVAVVLWPLGYLAFNRLELEVREYLLRLQWNLYRKKISPQNIPNREAFIL